VVALGPFYHLTDNGDRRSAAMEIARVLRPVGLLIAAFMPRLSGLAGLVSRAVDSPDQVRAETLERIETHGEFHNASGGGFQEGYFPEPDEIVRLFESCGLQTIRVISTRSFAAGQEQQLLQIRDRAPELFAQFMRLIRHTQSARGAVALGGHALLIAKKPAHRAPAVPG
jgi:hypothetical protein